GAIGKTRLGWHGDFGAHHLAGGPKRVVRGAGARAVTDLRLHVQAGGNAQVGDVADQVLSECARVGQTGRLGVEFPVRAGAPCAGYRGAPTEEHQRHVRAVAARHFRASANVARDRPLHRGDADAGATVEEPSLLRVAGRVVKAQIKAAFADAEQVRFGTLHGFAELVVGRCDRPAVRQASVPDLSQERIVPAELDIAQVAVFG